MRPVYAGASVLVVLSVWEEGFGMVVPEAQGAGVPVIASRRGGLSESVGSGGILIDDFEDAATWAKTIEKVLGSQGGYHNLQRSGWLAGWLAHRRPEFTAESVLANFLRLIPESGQG